MRAFPAICAAAVVSGASLIATAQTYPSRPVNLIVPYSAGGPTDTLARIMGDRMRKPLNNQTIIVENITGAGGTLATARVARSAPDGYTLSIGHWGSHVVNGAFYTLPFNLLTDFDPLAMIATNPQMIISKNAVPAKNLKELIAWAKANSGKVLCGTGGVGASSHMGGIYFQNLIGGKFEFVPYRGAAPALQGLLAGEFDIYVTQVSSAVQLIRAGKVKAYAVMAKERQNALPDLPTVDEAGLPGAHTSIWHGMWAPKNTPKDIVAKLNAAIVESLGDATVQQRFSDLGQDIPPRKEQTPEALFALHKAEVEKWWPMIKAAGLKAE